MNKIYLLVLSLLGACGTTLDVTERGRNDAADPDGLVINARRSYPVKVTSPRKLPITISVNGVAASEAPRVMIIDPWQVMVLNIDRMLFSSGKLKVALDSDQTLTELAITSVSGVPSTVKVIEAAAKARDEMQGDK